MRGNIGHATFINDGPIQLFNPIGILIANQFVHELTNIEREVTETATLPPILLQMGWAVG